MNNKTYQSNTNNLEWQKNIIQTAEKYFNCDACNFEFKENTGYFILDTGIFFIHIKITKDHSSGSVSIMTSNWYSTDNIKFEEVCKLLNRYLKQKTKSLINNLI